MSKILPEMVEEQRLKGIYRKKENAGLLPR